MPLYYVSSNRGKIKEAQAILQIPLEITQLQLDEIQSLDVAEVVRKKALEAFKHVKQPLLVDDVSFGVDAWNGFPGPFIKFLEETDPSYDLLLRMVAGETNRQATIKCGMGYHDKKTVHVFIGEIHGTIAQRQRGTHGWGFDPIFIPERLDKTFAELLPEEKNAISHRGRALAKLKEFLGNQ